MASIRADVPGGRVPRVLRRDRKSYPGEGGDSHGEESKGREEEGCEEAIACARTPDSQLPGHWGWELAFSPDSLRPALAPAAAYPQACLLYTSPSPRDRQKSRMPSSA